MITFFLTRQMNIKFLPWFYTKYMRQMMDSVSSVMYIKQKCNYTPIYYTPTPISMKYMSEKRQSKPQHSSDSLIRLDRMCLQEVGFVGLPVYRFCVGLPFAWMACLYLDGLVGTLAAPSSFPWTFVYQIKHCPSKGHTAQCRDRSPHEAFIYLFF